MEAVRGPAEQGGPEGRPVALDHPASRTGQVSYAAVLPGGWAPPDGQRGDVAVLRLQGAAPADCRPARLRPCGPARGRSVRVFGQAEDEPPGIWIEARLLGAAGPDWIQLDSLDQAASRVRGGYSGAGAVDEDGDVVGIVVAALRSGAATAWMIPVESAVRYCPVLADAVPADGRESWSGWPRGADRELATALARIPAMRDPQRRDSVLRDAGEDLFHLAERSPVLIEDLRGVAELCVQYADGVDRLVDALRWYERDSLPMRELERTVRRLREGGPTP